TTGRQPLKTEKLIAAKFNSPTPFSNNLLPSIDPSGNTCAPFSFPFTDDCIGPAAGILHQHKRIFSKGRQYMALFPFEWVGPDAPFSGFWCRLPPRGDAAQQESECPGGGRQSLHRAPIIITYGDRPPLSKGHQKSGRGGWLFLQGPAVIVMSLVL